MRRAARLRTAARVGAAALLVAGAACMPVRAASAAVFAQAPAALRLAAELPDPAVVAQGVSSANPAHVFEDPASDFARMRQVFNTVALLPGDPSTVDAARRAGLAVVLEFDDKADFFAGRSIDAKVAAVARQISANPGTIAAVHVADRLNERYSAQDGLRYLAATGGVLHRLVPGVPVLVNASDWQLTCGLPGQSSCGSHGPRFQYETDATLDLFARSGYLDGISIADNLKNEDAAGQAVAWQRARARWPHPFLLWATCSQLSFGQATYPGTPPAEAAARAYMLVPVGRGADAVALWAWHQVYQGAVDTFLDKDGGSNAMWRAMTVAAARIAAPGDRSALAEVPVPAGGRASLRQMLVPVLVGLVVLPLVVLLLVARAGRRAPAR